MSAIVLRAVESIKTSAESVLTFLKSARFDVKTYDAHNRQHFRSRILSGSKKILSTKTATRRSFYVCDCLLVGYTVAREEKSIISPSVLSIPAKNAITPSEADGAAPCVSAPARRLTLIMMRSRTTNEEQRVWPQPRPWSCTKASVCAADPCHAHTLFLPPRSDKKMLRTAFFCPAKLSPRWEL